MRALVVSVLLLGIASPVAAQQKGSFVLDATTNAGRHFGAGFYLTEGFSIRPSLGLGWSGSQGTFFDLGVDARYELLPLKRVTPYLAGSYNLMRTPHLAGSIWDVGEPATLSRWGGGAGLRARIDDRFSVFGEGRVMNSQVGELTYSSLGPQRLVDDGAHFEGALGLTFYLN